MILEALAAVSLLASTAGTSCPPGPCPESRVHQPTLHPHAPIPGTVASAGVAVATDGAPPLPSPDVTGLLDDDDQGVLRHPVVIGIAAGAVLGAGLAAWSPRDRDGSDVSPYLYFVPIGAAMGGFLGYLYSAEDDSGPIPLGLR